MIKKYLFYGAASLAILLLVFSCAKSGKVNWVNYDQTRCADKWGSYRNNEDLKLKIKEYFDSKKINVYDIEIYTINSGDTCLDCTCKTGRRIKLKVFRRDLDEIKQEGFYQ